MTNNLLFAAVNSSSLHNCVKDILYTSTYSYLKIIYTKYDHLLNIVTNLQWFSLLTIDFLWVFHFTSLCNQTKTTAN